MRHRSLVIWICLLLAGCTQPGSNSDSSGGDQNGGSDAGTGTLPVLADPPPFAPDDSLIPTPAVSSRAILNEVRYDTPQGEPQFVELKGVTGAQLVAGLELVNDKNVKFSINPSVTPADANGIVTIYFDGQNAVQGDSIHADAMSFLSSGSGFVALQDTTAGELDRLSWGPAQPGSVVERGSGVLEFPAGASLSRRPESITPAANDDWFVSGTALSTPGRPNRHFGVNMLFPLDGAIVLAAQLRVDWAFVHGPSQYRVQVATEPTFAAPLADQIVADGPVPLTLEPGGYYWRVQAQFADGSLADWSQINRLVVVATEVEGETVPETNKGLIAQQGGSRRTVLSHPVPQYFQHKDSYMLELESDFPSGTRHAWDAPHPELDKNDPADNANCARAATSMTNGYFAGAGDDAPNLTQDRIGLQVFTTANDLGYPGPEFDLGYGRGLSDEEYTFALNFALGGTPTYRRNENLDIVSESYLGFYRTEFREKFWTDLGDSIAADKPMPISAWTGPKGTYMHAIVAVGRFLKNGVRYVQLNDPWYGRIPAPLDLLKIRAYWILPDNRHVGNDEEDLHTRKDTDKDGVMDFDEEMRFGTNKSLADSDSDCVDDMAEIRASVFNTKHGWGIYHARKVGGLAQISDGRSRMGKATETDADTADSDGGGLNDPMEDLNRNGKYEPEEGETDPFDPSDDARNITGFYRTVTDELDSENGFTTHTVQEVRTDYDLKVGADGKITGTVTVKHTFKNTRDFTSFDEDCPGPRHDETTWEIDFSTPAEASFICQGLSVKSTVPRSPQSNIPAKFTDSCDGTSNTTFSGPVNSWGVTNLGTFDERTPTSVIYRHSAPLFPGSDTLIEYDISVRR